VSWVVPPCSSDGARLSEGLIASIFRIEQQASGETSGMATCYVLLGAYLNCCPTQTIEAMVLRNVVPSVIHGASTQKTVHFNQCHKNPICSAF
jgi:hypothetical protein